jgi:hypothetical protein
MKHIKVESCRSCPYFGIVLTKNGFCEHSAIIGEKIEGIVRDIHSIPSWCPLESLPEWISVKDRLPSSEWYLVYLKCGAMVTCYYSTFTNRFLFMGEDITPKVLFWQPLPVPPKEDEG